jgi:hypothetical protein
MVQEHALTIEYALTRREAFQFFLGSMAASPKYRRTILFLSGVIGTFGLAFQIILDRSLTLSEVIIAFGWSVGFLIIFPLFLLIRGRTTKRTVSISRGGLYTEMGQLKGQIPWARIGVVTDTPQFVLIARTNGEALYIPARAFSGLAHRSQFLAEIRNWMQESA